MWKSKAFVLALFFISVVQGDNVIQRILTHLERVYNYMLEHHDSLNVDSVFGVVLSQGFKNNFF